MLLITAMICTVLVVLLSMIIIRWGRKKQEQKQREMAQYIRREY